MTEQTTAKLKEYAKELIQCICESNKEVKLEVTSKRIGIIIYGEELETLDIFFETLNKLECEAIFEKMIKILKGE